jgi:hypothetical protein
VGAGNTIGWRLADGLVYLIKRKKKQITMELPHDMNRTASSGFSEMNML